MEHRGSPVTTNLLRAALAALLAVAPLPLLAETLLYKTENKWVAPEDNKPLQALLKAARNGKTAWQVKLPKDNRALAITRLEIVQNLLAREAKSAIVMEEVGTAAKANTLEIK